MKAIGVPDDFRRWLFALFACALVSSCAAPGGGMRPDPLPSWETGPARSAILDFVARVSNPADAHYVPPADRLAVFDNDGTLIVEQPAAFQFAFIFDRVRALAADRPDWLDTQPFQTAIDNDFEALRSMNYLKRRELGEATSANISEDAFAAVVDNYVSTARHPRFDRPYTEVVYQPMLELIALLQASEFTVFIVSGGGIEFIRAYSEPVYGIPRQNVIGSTRKLELREEDGRLVIYRLPATGSINSAKYKPLNIQLHAGRRPIFAAGNSDGDFEMLQFTSDNQKPSLVLLLQHDDPTREYAYAEDSVRARGAVAEAGWQIVSMREDFKRIFPEPAAVR